MQMKWLAILALTSTWPVTAQEAAESADFRAMSDAELRARVDAVDTDGFSDACRSKMPLFAEVVRRFPSSRLAKQGSLIAQAFCAYEQQRHEDGLRLLKQAESDFPERHYPGLGLVFAERLKDGAEALERLRLIVEAGELADFPTELVYAGVRTLRSDGLTDELDELGSELTSSSDFADLDPELQSLFASGAIRHGFKIGDLSRLAELLRYDSNPSSYLSMLSDREYEAAWPQIEERAGDNLAKVAEAYVRLTAERLAEVPEDRDRLSRYAYALLYAGRFQEAIDVARNWRPQRDNLQGLEEGEGWSLNIEAYALDALGRRSEADAVFDQLVTLPADEYPWVVNFVINRASRLVGQERWEQGLDATELARSVADKHGTTYARMLVARDRACALHRLGRSEDASREADFLVENFDHSAAIATTGLMCVGREREAEGMIAAALSDPVAREALVSDMQDPRFELFYTASRLPQARELILANEGLREEALKHVRVLPERLVPVSYLKRVHTTEGAR